MFWKSKKQDNVYGSSTEVEYGVMTLAITEIVWLHWLLSNMNVSLYRSTPMYNDNKKNVIQITHNSVFHEYNFFF